MVKQKTQNPNRSPQSEDIVCQDEAGQSNTGGLVATKVSRYEGKHGNGTHKPKLTASEDKTKDELAKEIEDEWDKSSAPNDIQNNINNLWDETNKCRDCIELRRKEPYSNECCHYHEIAILLEEASKEKKEATLAETVRRLKDEIEFLESLFFGGWKSSFSDIVSHPISSLAKGAIKVKERLSKLTAELKALQEQT